MTSLKNRLATFFFPLILGVVSHIFLHGLPFNTNNKVNLLKVLLGGFLGHEGCAEDVFISTPL